MITSLLIYLLGLETNNIFNYRLMRAMRDSQYKYLMYLLNVSSLSEEERDDWESRINDMGSFESMALQSHLEMHQIEPISNGQNYKMRDIHNKLNSIIADDKK